MNIADLRRSYHSDIFANILRANKPRDEGGYPNFADGSSALSVLYAWEIVERIGLPVTAGQIPGQTAGSLFEKTTRDYVERSFSQLQHIRPGDWQYVCLGTAISNYVQYEHLAEIEAALAENRALKAAFGGNYIVSPDIVIGRAPVDDSEFNRDGILDDGGAEYARHTPLRATNQPVPRHLLHAVISCKWTLRNDRAQNTKTEVLNLIRNRKGHLPHIVAVTAEPMPSRLAALALGTGDLDCVYHFALNELLEAVRSTNHLDALDILEMMVDGKRLRDISDLPFDLAA